MQKALKEIKIGIGNCGHQPHIQAEGDLEFFLDEGDLKKIAELAYDAFTKKYGEAK